MAYLTTFNKESEDEQANKTAFQTSNQEQSIEYLIDLANRCDQIPCSEYDFSQWQMSSTYIGKECNHFQTHDDYYTDSWQDQLPRKIREYFRVRESQKLRNVLRTVNYGDCEIDADLQDDDLAVRELAVFGEK